MTEPEDDRSRTIGAITATDGSIAHHNAELRRLWALRGSLAARLEQLGTRPPVAPPQDPSGISGPAPAQAEIDDWVANVELEPVERPRVGQQLIERMAKAGIVAPEQSEVPRSTPSPVELLPLNVVIDGDRRYEKVLLRTQDLPAQRFEVWVHDGRIQETHLLPVENHPQDTNRAPLCGFRSSGDWWRPGAEDFEAQFELCFACARYIPGSYLRQQNLL